MKRFILIPLWILSLAGMVQCQTPPHVTIRGHVSDDSTDSPLHSANVFIAGSMMNTATNTDGTYELHDVPLGSHVLIISLVGYETISYALHLARQKDRTLDFRLRPRTISVPTTEITGQFNASWKEHLEIFTKEFIGSSANAKKCRIINPEILDFKHDPVSGTLSTLSEQPLIVENRALGYRIMMLLNDFEKSTGLLRYTVQLRFEKLAPPDSSAAAEWKKNRLRAYRGSFRHFLYSVIANRVAENGFVVQLSNGPNWGETTKYDVNRYEVVAVTTDSLYRYERYINFPGFIRVLYLNEGEPCEFVTFRQYDGNRFTPRLEHQTSWIVMQTTHATIDLQGNLLLPYSVKVYGYWAFQRIADSLPTDYDPDEPE